MDKKEQTRLRVERYRDKKKALQKGSEALPDVTQNQENVTNDDESVTLDVTQCPAILHALVDPIKREKLEKIYQSLNNKKLTPLVYYGIGKGSVPFDVVGDLLEATQTH